MTIWKITKHYRGGSTTYQANMPKGWKMRRGYWEYQLQDWGENTFGGHNYGWNIKAVNVRNPVKVLRRRWGSTRNGLKELQPVSRCAKKLKFNKDYLEKR